MLTDRQKKIYNQISSILSEEHLSTKELECLYKAKIDLEHGRELKKTINFLCLSLEKISSYKALETSYLNKSVKKLLQELIDIYGKPHYGNNFESYQYSYYRKNFYNEQDWKINNDKYEYRASGQYSGWTKRENVVPTKRSIKEQVISMLKSLTILLLIALLLFTPLFSWIEQVIRAILKPLLS